MRKPWAAPVSGAAFFLLATLCPPAAAAAAADTATLTQALAAAEAQQLHQQPGWRALLHHEPTWAGGSRSTVDSDWFFLDPRGHRDPRAELRATLRALHDNRHIEARDEPAACVFSARHAWLAEQLDLSMFPAADCARRDAWLAALNPQRAWLVFPAAYLNSPASMFGHTLLRIDGAVGSDESALLAYAVNFAAETTDTNGVIFAVKGLTGGYRGQFAVMPYYEKVREYARVESRDLWEYPLHLDPAELHRVMLHLWELRGADFDYYFFTKNCSYQLLALLQVARPQPDLRQGFSAWAIPTDTIRSLRAIPGLLGEPEYRPALATRIQAHGGQLGAEGRRRAVALGRERITPADLDPALPAVERARRLDLAHDWLYHRYQAGALERDDAVPRARRLLAARAATGVRSGFDPVPAPATPPDAGHGTRRLGIGGFADGSGSGLRLQLRPAYHDLLDPPAGYGEGHQIAFMDISLSADLEHDRLRLESLHLIDIISLAPRDDLFQPISWHVATGARRSRGRDGPLGAYLAGGPGLSWRAGPGLAYGLLTLEADLHRDYRRGHQLGGGGRAGLLLPLRPTLRMHVYLEAREPLSGERLRSRAATLALQWAPVRDWAVRAELGLLRREGETGRQATLTLLRHFGPRFGPQRHDH